MSASQPPGPTMDIGSEPITVTAIWESTMQYSCPNVVGGADIARLLVADLNASAPGFLGSRECPAGGLDVVLQFGFAGTSHTQDVDLVVDGCNGANGPGPDDTNAYVTVYPTVFKALETLTPPTFLPDVEANIGP